MFTKGAVFVSLPHETVFEMISAAFYCTAIHYLEPSSVVPTGGDPQYLLMNMLIIFLFAYNCIIVLSKPLCETLIQCLWILDSVTKVGLRWKLSARTHKHSAEAVTICESAGSEPVSVTVCEPGRENLLRLKAGSPPPSLLKVERGRASEI